MIEARYANSKVYMLVDDDGYYYYGSSCLPLYKRLYNHKRDSKLEYNRKIYTVFTHERFCKDDIKMFLVEEFKLENKEQLLREENKYIHMHINDPLCLNSSHALLSYEERKENKKQQDKVYNETHKEQKKERAKIYNETHKEECIERCRLYRINNREKLIEYNKIRNQTEERKAYQKQKNICVCGSEYNKDHKTRHEKTIKHQEFIKKQQE